MQTAETNHTPDAHSSVVGGSTADRVIGCPKSVSAIAALPPEPKRSSSYAEEGTALHDAIAHILLNDLGLDDVRGMTFNEIALSDDVIDTKLAPALEFFDSLLDECDDEGGMKFTVETKCEMPGIPGAWGTSDIVGRTDKRSLIIDWKFGRTEVYAEENTQGKFYARAAKHSHPEMFEDDPDWQVDIFICQPMQTGSAGDVWSTTVADLEVFRFALAAAVTEALGDDPRRASGLHCKWARCQDTCPLHVTNAGVLAAKLKDTNEKSLELHHQQLAPTPNPITEEELAERYGLLLALADELEPVFKDIRSRAHIFAEEQLEYVDEDQIRIPGRVLVDTVGNRHWLDPVKAEKMLGRAGLSVKDRRVVKTISPAAAEKALKKIGKALGEQHYEKSKTGTALKRESPDLELAGTTSDRIGTLAARLLGNE